MVLRSRLIAPLLAVIAALLLAQYARLWIATPDVLARTSDFAGTYAAATLWREGDVARMYDNAAEQRVMVQAGAPADHLDIPFENPPAAAIVASPFSVLDAATAYRAWSLLQLLLVVAAVVIVARVAPWPERASRPLRIAIALVALAGFGTGALWIEGQWDGLLVLGVALAYWAWRCDRSVLAGLAIGVTASIAKPHLVLGIAAFMLGRREWRAIAGAAVGGAGTVAFTLLTAGVTPITAFVKVLTIPRYSPLVEMQGATGLFASWMGTNGTSYVLALIVSLIGFSVAAYVGARTRANKDLLEPALAAAVLLSLFGAPHLLSHDLALLAPALVFACAWIARHESRHAAAWPGWWTLCALLAWLVVSVASQHDLGNAGLAPPGRLTPWALAAVAAACVALTTRAALRRDRAQHLTVPSAEGVR